MTGSRGPFPTLNCQYSSDREIAPAEEVARSGGHLVQPLDPQTGNSTEQHSFPLHGREQHAPLMQNKPVVQQSEPRPH
jgi:hypothetical protein